MTESTEIENEEKFVDVRIWGIPEADFEYWMKLVRAYDGNRRLAFRVLLDSYAVMSMIGQLKTSVDIMETKITTLEQKWQREGGNLPKTFGGGI